MLQFGIDHVIAANPVWKKQPIGLVTNDAATTIHGKPGRQELLQAGFNIIKLFSPEHGIQRSGEDGARMPDAKDQLTGLPVTSLYNHKIQAGASDLEDIEILLFDIPDIGCRFYTYLWTMTHLLESAAAQNIPLIILDRPNPVSGIMELVEGPLLDEASCSSFIGRWSIPVRHSCTLGELALYFNHIKNIRATLEVIACSHWKRDMFHPDWGVDFVPTSPAITSFQAALLYPGLGLLEASNISEGRGTAKPFQWVGAPWLKSTPVIDALQDQHVSMTPESFIPTENKYAQVSCPGFSFYVNDPVPFRPVQFALRMIRLIKDLYPAHFSWQPYPTMVNPTGKQHLDLLLGMAGSESLFSLPADDFDQWIGSLAVPSWQQMVKPFLLYE